MENRFISFNDCQIFYRLSGSGKAVVLIHGFGEDGNIWDHIAGKLEQHFTVIVPDLPGSGRSEGLKNFPQPVSMDSFAEVVATILKTERLQKCTVIGHSMGGYITLAIAEKFPRLLNGFGLVNSTAFADTDDKKITRQKSIDFIQKNGAHPFLKTSIPGLFADTFKSKHPEQLESLIESVKYFSPHALIQYTTAMMDRPERISVLQNTHLPVLFIIGESDPAIPLEKSLAQSHLAAINYVHILPGTGHMAMLEDEDLCAGLMIDYLNSI